MAKPLHRNVGEGVVDDAEVGGEAPQLLFLLLWCQHPYLLDEGVRSNETSSSKLLD
jgi:hypothetical protein